MRRPPRAPRGPRARRTLPRLTRRPPAVAFRPATPPPPPMQISVSHQDGVAIVALAGSLDALTADALTDAMREQVRAGQTRFVAALAELEYTSSAGLRVLLETVKEARRRGGDLRLAAVQGRVQRVLDLSGFTSILKCFPDVPGAVASFAP